MVKAGSQEIWVQLLVLSQTSCVMLDTSLNFFVFQFPTCKTPFCHLSPSSSIQTVSSSQQSVSLCVYEQWRPNISWRVYSLQRVYRSLLTQTQGQVDGFLRILLILLSPTSKPLCDVSSAIHQMQVVITTNSDQATASFRCCVMSSELN